MSLFKTQSTTSRADRITQFASTTCDYGTPLPIAYGECKLSPNLINWQDFTTKEKRTTTKSGKSKSTQIDYLYYSYVELSLADGQIDGIGNVWVNDDKYSSLSTITSDKEGGALSVNLGNNNNPTAYMQSNHPDIAVGYNNMSYLYGKIFLGTNSASVPSYQVEVKGLLRNTGDGHDANPADVIIDLLGRVGLSQYVDSASFENYRKYCRNADLLISTPADAFTSQTQLQNIVNTIMTLTNSYMIWSVDRFKIIVRDDRKQGEWTPNRTVMYDLTEDDFIKQSDGACVVYSVKESSLIYNRFGVSFTNRSNEYEEETVFFDNTTDIAQNGLRANSVVDGKWFHTKKRAIKCAEMLARVNNTETVKYTVKLDWAFERLEVGDLITLTDSAIGLNKQICMIDEITVDTVGRPTITAIKRADGNYSQAQYSVHDNDYNYVNMNIDPSNTANPLFIIPPADLISASSNGIEVWIALQGTDDTWGGCDVYLSDKDGDYTFNGSQGVSSTYGKITSALSASGTSVSVHFSNPKDVSILTGSAYDAEKGNTLIWINGECMSYTQSTLTARNTYTLTGLIRGQYGTKAVSHVIGEDVAVLDGNLYVVPLTKHYLHRTLYFKFPAFNAFQANNQDIADLDYYTCIANTADLPNCTNLIAYNKYRELADDVTRYDIQVEWNPPDFSSYEQAQVWYKTSGTQANNLGVISEGTIASAIGLDGKWLFGGQGYNAVTLPQAIIGDKYKIAVCTQDIYGNTESPDMSAQVEILVAMKTETPNTPANLSVSLTNTFNILWNEVRNSDIKYYEVRLDANVGIETENLLIRTTETSFSTNSITNRTGTIYVFAVSAYNKASSPAKITYNFPKPTAPQITATSKLQGIECYVETIPTDCIGVHWYFDGTDSDEDIKTLTKTYFYSADAGVYEVNACYYDYFGDGYFAGSQMVTIEAYIPAELIASESISLEKLSAEAQRAIEEGGTETVNVAVKGMLGEGSALVLQPSGELALVASNGQKLTGLFANQDGVMRLQGEYIHITGNTVVDGSIITNNMLVGGISADKINVTSLSAITATIGTLRTKTSGARVEISDNLIKVYDSNNTLRVRLGIW